MKTHLIDAIKKLGSFGRNGLTSWRIRGIVANPGKDWLALGVDNAMHPFSTEIEELRARFLQPVVNE